ncbi:MAG: hypothetical protein PHP00_05500 [Thiotrichaceae bacterium]|nr:hypothetical protein [Thiotrichaceae bacterium]
MKHIKLWSLVLISCCISTATIAEDARQWVKLPEPLREHISRSHAPAWECRRDALRLGVSRAWHFIPRLFCVMDWGLCWVAVGNPTYGAKPLG